MESVAGSKLAPYNWSEDNSRSAKREAEPHILKQQAHGKVIHQLQGEERIATSQPKSLELKLEHFGLTQINNIAKSFHPV